MCTSIALLGKGFCFGRTLDLDREFGEGAVVTPRNYVLNFRCGEVMRRHLAFVGMATVADGYPLYADGMNEHGVCIAGLEFRGNAHYPALPSAGKRGIAPFEVIPYLLARCESLDEARGELEKISIVDVPFNDEVENSPLHWHIADESGSLVVEQTADGMHVYENPFGVLANNPPFPFHRDNYMLYLGSTSKSVRSISPGTEVYCSGIMGRGIPGDYTSPSRFVRAAWLAEHARYDEGEEMVAAYSLLGAVAPPRGAVTSEGGDEHYTRYTCVMDAKSLTYTYKTARDTEIRRTYMKKESLDSEALI